MSKMNYLENTMKENSLGFIRDIFIRPVRERFAINICLSYVFLVYVIQNLIFIHKSLTAPNRSTFVQYAPLCFGSMLVPALVLNFAYVQLNGLEPYERMVMTLRSIDSAGLRVKSRILRESRLIKNNFKLLIVIVTLCGIFLLPVIKAGEDMWFLLKFIKENFETFSWLLSLAFYATFPVGAIMTIVQAFLPLYFMKQGIFQLYMLKEFIEDISTKNDKFQMNILYYSKNYQKVVRQKLIFCVRMHDKIKTYLNFGKNLFFLPLVVMYLVGILMTTVVMFGATGFSLDITGYPVLLLTAAILVMSLTTIIQGGQSVIDETTAVFETACKCPWYLWNNENKKIYFFFLMNSVKPVQISATSYVIITYNVVTKMVRRAFSITTVVNQVTNLNTS